MRKWKLKDESWTTKGSDPTHIRQYRFTNPDDDRDFVSFREMLGMGDLKHGCMTISGPESNVIFDVYLLVATDWTIDSAEAHLARVAEKLSQDPMGSPESCK